MQRDLERLNEAGIQVVGISYDKVPILKMFSDQKDIQFPLLSDPDSQTIKTYGILNPETKVLPYPGTFVLDETGVVRAKLFEDGYRTRHSTEELIEAAEAIR